MKDFAGDKWKKSKRTILGIQADELKTVGPGGSHIEYRIKTHLGEIWEYSPGTYAAYVNGRRYLEPIMAKIPSVAARWKNLKEIPYDQFEECLFYFNERDAGAVLRTMEFTAPAIDKTEMSTPESIQNGGSI